MRHLFSIMLLLVTVVFAQPSWSQDKGSVVGYVHSLHKLGKMEMSLPVGGCTVSLYMEADTLSTVSKDGDFAFKDLAVGQTVLLGIKATGYVDFLEPVLIEKGEKMVVVEMTREGEKIEGAVVTSQMPLAVMKGDTLVYNASAVKQMEGDFAVDIFRQLPGVEVSEHSITVGGVQVSRAYINGVLVFGRDPMDAVNNLSADQVLSVKVYDEVADHTESLTGRDKKRVMDIETKNPILEVTDIQTYLAGGADAKKDASGRIQGRYGAGFLGRFFSENLQLRTDLVGNNIGESTEYLTSFIYRPTSLTNYEEKTGFSLGVEKYWGKNMYTRNGVNIRYGYTDDYSRSGSRSLTEYFQTDYSPGMNVRDTSSHKSRIRNHSLLSSAEVHIGKTLLTWSGSTLFSSSDIYGLNSSEQTDTYGNALSQQNETGSRLASWNTQQTFSLRGTPINEKIITAISVSANAKHDENGGFQLDTLQSSFQRRYLDMSGTGDDKGLRVSVENTFNLGKGLLFAAGYTFDRKINKKKQLGYDVLDPLNPVPSSVHTYDYTYDYLSNSVKINIGVNTLQLWAELQVNDIVDDEAVPESLRPVDARYVVVLPSGRFYTNGKNRVNIELRLSSSAQLPTLQQVRDRLDDRNALRVNSGNPDLKAGVTYTGSLQIRPSQVLNSPLNLSASITSHPIVSRDYYYAVATTLDGYEGYVMPAGSVLSTYTNADWSAQASLSKRWSGNLSLNKGSFRPGYSIDLDLPASVRPFYQQEYLTRTTEFSPGLMLSMNGTLDSHLRMSMSSSIKYTSSVNTGSDFRTSILSSRIGAGVTAVPSRNTNLELNYNWNPYRNLVSGYSRDHHFLSASAGITLLKGDMTVSLDGIDLLNSGSVSSSLLSANSLTQSWRPVYGRYFLLSIKYRFNNSRGKYFMSTVSTPVSF